MQTVDLTKRFIKDYTEAVFHRLGITEDEDKQKVVNIIQSRIIPTNLTIFNSVDYEYTDIDSAEFWYDAPKKYILNEEGVLFWKTELKEAISAVILANDIALRQVFKKAKNRASAIGDKIAEEMNGTYEALTKLMINGSTYRGPKLGD